jgi:polyisoprenoid-binding protein YceI
MPFIRGRRLLLMFLLVADGGAVERLESRTWVVEPGESEVTFTVTKYGFERVHGRFNRFDAAVVYYPDAPQRSSIRWRVDVGSVDTGEPRRDRALQSTEYFDAAAHPELFFESRRARPVGEGRLEVSGDITIRGKTRPLTIVVRPAGADRFESSFTLDRYDFGVAGGGVMGMVIGRTVKVHLVATVRRGVTS